MWQEYNVCGKSLLYVATVYCMWQESTVCGRSLLYVARVYCVWQECTVCGNSLLYVARVYCMWQESTVCGKSIYCIQSLSLTYLVKRYEIWTNVDIWYIYTNNILPKHFPRMSHNQRELRFEVLSFLKIQLYILIISDYSHVINRS